MKRFLFMVPTLMVCVAQMSPTPAAAQVDPLNPIPGGASAASVVCLQAGDLNSGAFLGTFVETAPGRWEETAHAKLGLNRFAERQRDEVAVVLHDADRRILVQFDFARKRVKTTPDSQPDDWKDAFHILNATDKDGSADCVALATAKPPPAGAPPRHGTTPIVLITIKIGTALSIPPGTKLTAVSGPPCPSRPGFFLCPNKFSCAPTGGVCCPGTGACSAGTFCDRFIPNSCIGPADPAFCKGTGNPATGISLHCAPGSTCIPGNFCVP